MVLKIRLTQRIADWKNEVTIQHLGFAGNFTMPNGSITGDQMETTATLTVQAGTRPDQSTLSILGQSQVPFNKDAAATDRPHTLVSLPRQPITITVNPLVAAQSMAADFSYLWIDACESALFRLASVSTSAPI
jgi:hypothetical protein